MGASLVKRILIGRPLPTHRLAHERLNKTQGLAVFSSDALSSSAYATEEILLALIVAGPLALSLAWPISIGITTVLALVVFSYYQTIHAYPRGGGSYIVARSNLGVWPGLTAGSALLIDYILTVSVSISAGVAAITSAIPALLSYRVSLSLLFIAFIAVINLRGIRESGRIFSVPTYVFIATMLTMLVLGFARALGSAPISASIEPEGAHVWQPLTLLLILRAFASGSAAMTGVEAISDGIPAFRPPESRNAGITLIWMAVILSTLFLGITFLTRHFGLVPTENETIVSQLGRTVFGSGAAYYLAQSATAAILILAANTSFADFPRLAFFLARDDFLPHQFRNLGDRLVYANGILILSIVSGLLIYVFDARTHGLIPLYAVGVFLSFTLSQSGMVKKWWTERGRGWSRSIVFNFVGAVATAVVLVVVIIAKFKQGAWIVALLIPAFILVMRSIWAHYQEVAKQLTLEGASAPSPVRQHKVVIPIGGMHKGVLPALRYATSISDDVTAVMVDVDSDQTAKVVERWKQWGMGVPLKVLESPYRSVLSPILRYLDDLEWEVGFEEQLTVLLPEFVPSRWWHFLLHNQTAFLLKAALFFRRRKDLHRVTVVTDVPYYLHERTTSVSLRPGAVRPHVSPAVAGASAVAVILLAGFLVTLARGGPPLMAEILGVALLVMLGVLGLMGIIRGLQH